MYVPLAVRIRSINGNSPSFSFVRRCQCPPHKRKALSDTCTSPLSACAVCLPCVHVSLHDPLLHTFTRLAATDAFILLLLQAATWLQAVCGVAGGAGRRNIRTSPYMGMSLILKICNTETFIGIACNDANTCVRIYFKCLKL